MNSQHPPPDAAELIRAENGVLQPLSSGAVPRLVDREAAMQFMQRYVETERRRNRRILVWICTVFLLIVVVVLTVFAMIGIFVVRNTRETEAVLGQLAVRHQRYESEVTGVSNRLSSVVQGAEGLRAAMQGAEVERQRQRDVLQTDLMRFSQWVGSQRTREQKTIEGLEKRLAELEAAAAGRMKASGSLNGEVSTALAGDDFRREVAPKAGETVPAVVVSTNPAVSVGVLTSRPLDSHGEVATVQFANGDRYEGQFRDGLFNGHGVYIWQNGDRYEGPFVNDVREGYGALFFRNGDRYAGEFRGDAINGNGSMNYAAGGHYEGGFRAGLRHGVGTLRFANGDSYQGEFAEDVREGKGTYTFSNGAKYTGDFHGGKRHGRGRYVYPSGEEYIGEFRDGKKHGSGECIYPNGERTRGTWENDEPKKVLEL